MPSPESQKLRESLVHDREFLHLPIATQRQEWHESAAQTPLASHIAIHAINVGGVPCEWLSSGNVHTKQILFYLHGGGYALGSCVTHREFAAALSAATNCRVFLIDYRLAPEHPFPAALEDALTAYHYLLNEGFDTNNIVFGGDSSGAGLALAMLVALRDEGTALPRGAFLLSPWLDLSMSGESIVSKAAIDPLIAPESLELMAEAYCGKNRKNPLVSPLFANLSQLCKLLIQVGSDEILLSDSERIAEKATAAESPADLQIWKGMWHVWQMSVELPESKEALERIASFVAKCFDSA